MRTKPLLRLDDGNPISFLLFLTPRKHRLAHNCRGYVTWFTLATVSCFFLWLTNSVDIFFVGIFLFLSFFLPDFVASRRDTFSAFEIFSSEAWMNLSLLMFSHAWMIFSQWQRTRILSVRLDQIHGFFFVGSLSFSEWRHSLIQYQKKKKFTLSIHLALDVCECVFSCINLLTFFETKCQCH